ncbi:MAG: alpha/beta hydrolase [Patescibacteria group bacterium]
MKTHIIYIPGLGDRYDGFRSAALKTWRLWNVTTEYVPITWYDGESLVSKLNRIEAAIERTPADVNLVLIGESAGATLALHMATHARVDRVITLCGVARGNTPVSSYLRRRAPALNEGVNGLTDAYNTDVQSVRAVIDGVVGKKYSVVSGATEHVIWSIGHLTTIALCLTLYAPTVTAIAKKQK